MTDEPGLRAAARRLADEAARAVTEPRRFHENEDDRQQALGHALTALRAALAAISDPYAGHDGSDEPVSGMGLTPDASEPDEPCGRCGTWRRFHGFGEIQGPEYSRDHAWIATPAASDEVKTHDELVDIIEQAIFETDTGLEAALLAADRLRTPAASDGSLDVLAREIAKDWNGRIVTGDDIRAAIDKACSLTNPRLSEVEWDEVAGALRVATEPET